MANLEVGINLMIKSPVLSFLSGQERAHCVRLRTSGFNLDIDMPHWGRRERIVETPRWGVSCVSSTLHATQHTASKGTRMIKPFHEDLAIHQGIFVAR